MLDAGGSMLELTLAKHAKNRKEGGINMDEQDERDVFLAEMNCKAVHVRLVCINNGGRVFQPANS